MPKRSTPFQAMVHLARQQLATQGVTVTESKFLVDKVLGIEREVDVVIEGELDGEPIVICIEVIERSRPADVTWVQGMLQKHLNLPTNRLLLVSKAGFSRSAITAVDRAGDRVQALTPKLVEADGEAAITNFYMDYATYGARGCRVQVFEGGGLITVEGQTDIDIYSADRELLGSLGVLAHELIHLQPVADHLNKSAHNHPEREDLTGFSLGIALEALGYQLRNTESGAFHLLKAIEVWGSFAWKQTEIALALTDLGGRVFGAAEAPFADRPAVWVGTTDVLDRTTTLSWRTTDTVGPPQRPAPFQPTYFTELTGLVETLALPEE
ncbi:hypothetical protein [Amycolatopsis sp. NPDC098790]|uniref:hypothetical protein n=1 Tax=Amycolatopsis sp. NPDC098790 TaxID=3363939 RepID=UPI003801FCBC